MDFVLAYALSLGLYWIVSFRVFSVLDSIRLSKMLISIGYSCSKFDSNPNSVQISYIHEDRFIIISW